MNSSVFCIEISSYMLRTKVVSQKYDAGISVDTTVKNKKVNKYVAIVPLGL